MVNCDMSIVAYWPGTVITPIPASCPAEVTVDIEIITACHHSNPIDIAIIPKVKETDRYPRPMGMPERKPLRKSFIIICFRSI